MILVIGAGPAGLMAAEAAARAGSAVHLYDRMPSAGRKLLMAGRGGLNLTHSEPLDRFLTRYGAAAHRLAPIIEAFPPAALCDWSEKLGQPTFVGSSGRIFPAALKASPLLRAWLGRLRNDGVAFHMRHRWRGWDARGDLMFLGPRGEIEAVRADAIVLALGGASWPRLGSDGGWTAMLAERGIEISALQPANCGFDIVWSGFFRERFAGVPLKRIALSFRGVTVRGEALITARGIEGGAVYALAAPIRDAIAAEGTAEPLLDLRPDFDSVEVARRLSAPRGHQSLPNFLRKSLKLAPAAIALLREGPDGAFPATPEGLARRIKAVPLRMTAPSTIARAISTAGGISLSELDANLMLRRLPGVFAAGEMLDWEAPTGGYLLQASFATGAWAGKAAHAWATRACVESTRPVP